MILGIDAFNLSSGGGITHLVELLRAAKPRAQGFERVVLWASKKTLDKIDDREWLHKVHEPMLDKGLLWRIFWHRFLSKNRAVSSRCNVLFLPGGTVANGFVPSVTMSRNMLPFEGRELKRYGWSFKTAKLMLLRFSQTQSFLRANGLVFLTNYARKVVGRTVKLTDNGTVTIPHGIHNRFFIEPRVECLADFTIDNPCRILYVSIISPYKHQWHVVEAVARLRAEGVPVLLELIGPPAEGMKRMQTTINRVDPTGEFVFYRGSVPYEELQLHYAKADIGLFASSCENMPNILLEGMAAGLPMACSNMGPMPEILGDAGVYFNPLDSGQIVDALRVLINSPQRRLACAQSAFDRAKCFSWDRCAKDTLEFLAQVASNDKVKAKSDVF
jgi:glycosyltransferase involved in cell wall biosynthesis